MKTSIVKETTERGFREYFIITTIKLRKARTCDNLYCKNGEGENTGILSNTKKKNMLPGFESLVYCLSMRPDRLTSKVRKFCCIQCLKENLGMRSKIFGNMNKIFNQLIKQDASRGK